MDTTGNGARRVSFDIVSLAASAGGIEAVTAVLCSVPADFPAAIVVLMHFAESSDRLSVFAAHSELPVVWAEAGTAIMPGRVYVCPPNRSLELEPDGTCTLLPRSNVRHPIDA